MKYQTPNISQLLKEFLFKTFHAANWLCVGGRCVRKEGAVA